MLKPAKAGMYKKKACSFGAGLRIVKRILSIILCL